MFWLSIFDILVGLVCIATPNADPERLTVLVQGCCRGLQAYKCMAVLITETPLSTLH